MASPRGASSAASTSASSDSYQDAVVKIRPSKLFIGGLTQNTSTKLLREHFSKYGRVLDCIAMRHADGKARGFGYVTLDSREAATACVAEPQRVDGRVVDVKLAVPGRSRAKEEASKEAAAQKAGTKQPAAVTVRTVCPECARCGSCGACEPEGTGWKRQSSWRSGGGGWRDAWQSYGGGMNSSIWTASWGLEQSPFVPAASVRQAPHPIMFPPVAPPPGLPVPHGTSLFRTPSPSECSSSRASSPARSEAGVA